MKKTYLFLMLFSILFTGLVNSQSVIVTVDRPNSIGPTNTGNEPQISSIGFTRGTGVNLATNGQDFTSDSWNGTSQAEAAVNNEYIQWSVSAGAANSIEITGIDIRTRANNNGPGSWQIFYSLDNFSSPGTPVTSVQASANTNTEFNFSGLSISSGINATITFRLYAWNASTDGGWFRIVRENSWSDFGIASPGLRLLGNITTVTNSVESNIVSTSFDPDDNIDYTAYLVTSGLTTGNSLKIGEFTIQDGGDDITDADILPTILTAIGFDVTGATNLAAVALFDGANNVAEVTTVNNTISFSGLNLSAPDDSTYTFDIYASFNTAVTDNEQIVFSANSATADIANGSAFEALNAGGASTSTLGDDNRIEVTATALSFEQNTSNVVQFEPMVLAPIVIAVDSNANIDLDFTGNVIMTTSATYDPSAIFSVGAVNGRSVFNSLIFSNQGTGFFLIANDSTLILSSAVSNPFDVVGPMVTLAIQDFDGSTPEWSYSNDTPFFDNGWGIDGYYGLIDVNSASPIDYGLFSGNILGENDLNDEGNGTTGLATVTFDPVDISAFQDVILSFDWEIEGYNSNNDEARYEVFYDGVGQGLVFLLDGAGATESDEGSVNIAIPNTVNEVSLQISIRNNGLEGFSGFDNFKLSTAFNGLIYRNSVWSPNAPSGSTNSDNALLLDGTYTIASDVQLNDVIITNGASIEIEAAHSLIVNGNLFTNGNLNLQSTGTSYSSLIVEGNVQGDASYSRHVNNSAASGQNDLISAPVTGQAFDVFRSNNPNIVSNGSNTLFLFGPFDKTTAEYIIYTDAETTPLTAGTGYRAASTDDGNFNFNGIVNTANIDVTISDSGPSFQDWNLVGNPYPSYLSLSTFLLANNSEFEPLNSGVYGYDGDASDGWVVWNQAYSDANPNAIIAPGQGFFVASAPTGGTIAFTPGMRAIGSADDFIPGFSPEVVPTITHLKLNMSSDSSEFNTDFYFTDNASLGLDPGYDSGTFGGNAPSFAIYSQLVQDNQGVDMAIQSISNNDVLNNVVIPLGINASQGQQLTISIAESTLLADIDVYLEDTVENRTTLLNAQDYVFTPNTNINGTGRFNLRFAFETLSDSETNLNKLRIFNTHDPEILTVSGQLEKEEILIIYDVQGRLVKSYQLKRNNTRHQFDLSSLNSGIYIVQVGLITQKIILK